VSRNRLIYLIVVGVIIVLDQFSKFIVRYYLPRDEIIRLFDGDLIWLVFITNPGLAFGIRIIHPVILTVIAFIAAAGLGIFLFRTSSVPYRQGIPFALVMGGAIGNMIDRLIIGEVVDFISVDMPDFIMSRWPVFNVADSAVSIGVACLIFFALFIRDRKTDGDVQENS